MAKGTGRKRGTTRRKTSSSRRTSSGARSPARRKSPTRSTSAATRKRSAPKGRRKTSARKRKTTRTAQSFLRRIARLSVRAVTASFVILAAGLVALLIYGRDLPPVGDLASARRLPRAEIQASSGDVIGIKGRDHGRPIDAGELPPHVIGAFLATEDRNFYHHVGVNPIAIFRALIVNMRAGDVEQGGSTITQQLVKNLLLTSEQSLDRKLKEMLLALKIEATYSKDEILSFYLNAVYFGNGAYGLEAAARRYFDKAPQDLSIGEAAILAGLLKAPTRLALTNNENAAIARARIVLTAMVEADVITHGQAKSVNFSMLAEIAEDDLAAAYAADHAYVEARRLLGDLKQDVIIETTIDLYATQAAMKARENIEREDKLYTEYVQSAAVVLNENGAIQVLIGGNDYRASPYNRATLANRQPGSAFKPFVYLTALEQGATPEEVILDEPIEIGSWAPKNYKNVYAGRVPLTEAMSRSLNAAAVRLQEEVGREHVFETARRLGLDLKEPVPSMALGTQEVTPLELASAYLPFSGGGISAQPYIVTRIMDMDGNTLYTHTPRAGERVVDPDSLIAFDYMMREVVRAGSGRRARIQGHYAAGKTGTTQDSRDAWFAGYASGLVGVVWLGQDKDLPETTGWQGMSGSGSPAKWWGEMMTAALEDMPVREPTPYIPAPASDDTLLSHLAELMGVSPERRRRQGRPPASIEDIISGQAAPSTQSETDAP